MTCPDPLEPSEEMPPEELEAAINAMIRRSLEDIKAGRVHDARESLRQIAAEHGVNLNR